MRWALLLASLLIAAPGRAEPESPQVAAPQLPEGWIAVSEADWERLRHEPTLRFRAARAHLDAGHAGGAARELQRGAAFVRIEAARAPTPESAADLGRAAQELEALAEVLAETPEPPGDFDETIARAHYALAVSHALRAQQRWESQGETSAPSTGADLEAAADHLEEAASWSDRLKGGAVATVDQTRRLAGGLIRADGWAIETTAKAIGAVGQQIGNLGRWLAPEDQDTPAKAESPVP